MKMCNDNVVMCNEIMAIVIILVMKMTVMK
jgi:hypothetical protein